MKIGLIGLGKMGSQIVQRLESKQINCVVFDSNNEAINALSATGSQPANSVKDLVDKLGPKPIVWVMIPAEYTQELITVLSSLLEPGSIVIDGGNSDFRQTIERAAQCRKKGIELIDIGVSGGIHGIKNGFSMMIGGEKTSVERILPVVKALSQPQGYGHFGPTGAGHFVKMIHNASEYGMMQSLAEGYNLIKNGPIKNIDLEKVAIVWENGSVVRSWLNQLCYEIFKEDQDLKKVGGIVDESGEAKWALETAKNLDIDLPATRAAFDVRKESQKGKVSFTTKVLAAMRNKFGGHSVNPS